MDRYTWMIIGSILGILVTALAVISPIVISDALEPIETAREGIRTYEELTEGNVTYTPYTELNSTTAGLYSSEGSPYSGIYAFDAGYHQMDITYNYDNYREMSIYPAGGSFSTVTLHMEVFASDMVEDQADKSYLYVNTSSRVRIDDAYYDGAETVPLTELETTEWQDGYNDVFNLTQSSLNDAGTFNCGGIIIQLGIETALTEGDTLITDLQISPEYYEETNTENTTVYEPYIRSISNPYKWTQWTLGIGGGSLFLVALVASSWINPDKWMDKHRGRGRRR